MPRLRQQHDVDDSTVYDSTDIGIFIFSTLIAITGAWALVQKEEWFLSVSSFGLALGFCVVSISVARSPSPTVIPWFSVFHILFWIVQFFYALCAGTPRHAVNAHERVSDNFGRRHAVVWVVMGAVGGFYPGSAAAKLALFLGSAFFITARNLILAYRWELSQADFRPEQQSAMRLLLDARDAALVEGHPTRLSTELLLHGWASFVGAALLGLSIGMLFRARSRGTIAAAHAAANAELHDMASAHQSEVAELRTHAVALETARREALVEKLRHRGGQRRAGPGAGAGAPGRSSAASGALTACWEGASTASQEGSE